MVKRSGVNPSQSIRARQVDKADACAANRPHRLPNGYKVSKVMRRLTG